MTKDEVQVNFRMPRALKQSLEEVARANNRSLTAEIVDRLETSLSPSPPIPKDIMDAMILSALKTILSHGWTPPMESEEYKALIEAGWKPKPDGPATP